MTKSKNLLSTSAVLPFSAINSNFSLKIMPYIHHTWLISESVGGDGIGLAEFGVRFHILIWTICQSIVVNLTRSEMPIK